MAIRASLSGTGGNPTAKRRLSLPSESWHRAQATLPGSFDFLTSAQVACDV
jgi:hypothetical protein